MGMDGGEELLSLFFLLVCFCSPFTLSPPRHLSALTKLPPKRISPKRNRDFMERGYVWTGHYGCGLVVYFQRTCFPTMLPLMSGSPLLFFLGLGVVLHQTSAFGPCITAHNTSCIKQFSAYVSIGLLIISISSYSPPPSFHPLPVLLCLLTFCPFRPLPSTVQYACDLRPPDMTHFIIVTQSTLVYRGSRSCFSTPTYIHLSISNLKETFYS